MPTVDDGDPTRQRLDSGEPKALETAHLDVDLGSAEEFALLVAIDFTVNSDTRSVAAVQELIQKCQTILRRSADDMQVEVLYALGDERDGEDCDIDALSTNAIWVQLRHGDGATSIHMRTRRVVVRVN